MSSQPYLSFVVAARNDNYGGDFLGRMQVFVNALLAMWTRCGLDAELVIVEWNPPPDKPRLNDAIRWPQDMPEGRVRIIEVPAKIHRQFTNSEKMPIFEYIAKNVGIRRARGEHVLSTNPDILFSDPLIRYFAAHKLRPDSFCRVDRYDVLDDIPMNLSVDAQLRFCSRHAFRFHHMLGSEYFVLRSPRHYLSRQLLLLRQKLRLVARKLLQKSLRQALGEFRDWARHPFRSPLPSSTPAPPPGPAPPAVHTNASGDFLLMSSNSWCVLRGYPELVTHSHVDSYLVYQAAIAGLHQVIVPHPIYHQEHDRSEQMHRPWTNLEELVELREMIATGHFQVTNAENWGLGDADLETIHVRDKLVIAGGR